jgi:D-glycero-alpha-D-manno-heptose-7-phosphate kinase
MIVRSRAPVRVDFAGAWTDVSYFASAFKGATLNAAIQMYVTGEIQADDALDAVFDAKRAAASGDAGKYQLPERPALNVTYGTPIPAGSGLGTSATLNCVWLALARREPVTSDEDKMKIAALAYDVEKTLGIIGGKQDQYASAIGGINLFEFDGDEVTRIPVELPQERARELEELLVLCYTGQARLSSNIHRNVWGNFRAGREETVRALFSLRDSAYEAKAALEEWDLDAFARILTDHGRQAVRRGRRRLHPFPGSRPGRAGAAEPEFRRPGPDRHGREVRLRRSDCSGRVRPLRTDVMGLKGGARIGRGVFRLSGWPRSISRRSSTPLSPGVSGVPRKAGRLF